MKVVISCGGTGGHLSPGIALAEELTRRGHEAVLLISRKKVDGRLSEKYPRLRFVPVEGVGLSGGVMGALRFLVSQMKGVFQCWGLVRRERPGVIVGFGGFTTAAVILVGLLVRVPVVLHESNRVPGRAIRLFGRFARVVYLPEGVKLGSVRKGCLREEGLPVRTEIFRRDKTEARRRLSIRGEGKVVVVFGGSQGANALNAWARTAAEELGGEGVLIYCVTGMGKVTEGAVGNLVEVPFCDEVGALLSAADVVVGRAGSGTIAELARCGTASVLVPYPQAADDHQRANAEWFRVKGCCEVLEQVEVPAKLSGVVRELLGNEDKLRVMRVGLEKLGMENVAGRIAGELEELVEVPR